MKRKSSKWTGIKWLTVLTLFIASFNQASAQCSQFTTQADTFCTNDPAITLAGTPTPGVFFGPGVSVSSFDPSVAGAGSHVIGYTANSCSDTAFITMVVQLLPTITFTLPAAQQSVCEFGNPFSISGNNPNPGWPTSWFTGNGVDSVTGTFTPSTTLLGYNTITFHYDDGVCSGTAIDSVEVLENPTVNIIGGFPDTCESAGAFILNMGVGIPSGGTGTYSGTGVTGGPSTFFFDPSLSGPGTHAITYCYTALNGCSTCVTQDLTVFADPVPTFVAPPPPTCENDSAINLTPFATPLGGYFTGPGILADSVTFDPALVGVGSYNINYVFVDSNGCEGQASDAIAVSMKPNINFQAASPLTTPDPPPDRANILIKICEGDTAYTSLSAPNGEDLASDGVDPDVFSWWGYNGALKRFNFQPPQDQVFTIKVTLAGCFDFGTVEIDVIPPATADITGPDHICLGDTGELEVSGAASYTWIVPGGQTGSPISVAPRVSTTYQVVADSDTDGDGNLCSSDTGEYFVDVKPLPLVTTGKDTTLFYGDETPLRAYGADYYVWSEGVMGELSCFTCDQPIAKPIFDLSEPAWRGYKVVGTDSLTGCMSSDSIYIRLNDQIVIFVPTAFSPNGDGINDVLYLESKGIQSVDFEIFDRFGKTVFQTTNLEEGWNGSFENDGETISKDVYLYRLQATPFEKTVPPINQAGEITLIR